MKKNVNYYNLIVLLFKVSSIGGLICGLVGYIFEVIIPDDLVKNIFLLLLIFFSLLFFFSIFLMKIYSSKITVELEPSKKPFMYKFEDNSLIINSLKEKGSLEYDTIDNEVLNNPLYYKNQRKFIWFPFIEMNIFFLTSFQTFNNNTIQSLNKYRQIIAKNFKKTITFYVSLLR